MALHHHLKPHHHVTIWAASALLVVWAAATAANTATIYAQEDHGPSEATESFFTGGKKTNVTFQEPESCQQTEQNKSENVSRHNAVMEELETFKQKGELTPEDQARKAQLEQEAQQLASQTNEGRSGPSEDCTRDIVKQMKSQMTTMRSIVNDHALPKLVKVESVLKKLEELIPQLREQGVSSDSITEMEQSIASIRTHSATMTTFLKSMDSAMAKFLSLADSDPQAAFESMQNMDRGSASTKAASAADELVSAFTKLETTLDKITNQ